MNTRTAFALIALTFTLPACGGIEEEDPYSEDSALDAKSGGRFETFTGRDGRFYFHLLAANGEKVMQSQGYATEQGADDGIASVRENGVYADPYQVLQAQNGQWYFNLYAGNWQVIATSELYVNRSNADRGVATAVAIVTKAKELPAPTTGARFQVFRGLDGKYYFHVRAANGEIVLQSQGYTKRASAVSGTSSVRANGVDARRYQIRNAADGQTYFVLTATNGQVIGVSETYASRDGAQQGMASVAALVQSGTIAAAQ